MLSCPVDGIRKQKMPYITTMKSIGVFCGSSSGSHPAFIEAAVQTGRLLAERNITLVYGGGSHGMMGAVASAALEHGGKVVGIIPGLLVEKEAARRDISELIVVGSMQERKAKLMERSDGFIVLPGGVGTMDELFEMMAFVNLGVHRKPSGILNTNGFYDGIIAYTDHAAATGFIRPATRRHLVHASEPSALLTLMEALHGQ